MAAKFHIQPDDVVRSSVANIKGGFWFYFSKLVKSVLYAFLYHFVCFIMYLLFTLHSCVLTMTMVIATSSRVCGSGYKKLSYRRGTARCVVSVEILSIATQQCSTTSHEQIEVMKLKG